MKKIIIVLFLTLFSSQAWATAQYPDRVIYKGKTLDLYANPLESLFDKDHPRPNKLFPSVCSACWRGYIATWIIKGGNLYLAALQEGSCEQNPKRIPLSKVFQGRRGPIKADWYSGTISIPKGKRIRYVHMGYQSVYEKELLIQIKKGRVVGERVIENSL